MGRTKIYATPEEAHEAKKKQMRENYQMRKAAKLAERAEESPKSEKPPRKTKKQEAPNTIQETVAQIGEEKKYTKKEKEQIIKKVLEAVTEALN